ncbi:hypothetical protein, conserved [Babesia bigemina]|uniref:GPI-anchored wall transfer protein 1 n=1 Tax=Babesia bigemina TaxID=5866 RepID=A0A061DCH6_BABBI|nr:hypothetical protein, conserved [Babesia bigemina]CDR95570.1 hypothetical protein, conserved [Babesia bigemina]|eukprot:XP_012767756.1 hypothetical protein, conserved [Babesia bigemina]
MDIGCGFMIIQSGSMSSFSRSIRKRTFINILTRHWTLFLLGFVRSLATSAVSYDVPVEEYGVHWNFFLSLGVTKIRKSQFSLMRVLLLSVIPESLVNLVPFVIAFVYEWLLWLFDAVHTVPAIVRTNLLTANKEGIVAVPNSVSLFFIGYCGARACGKVYRVRGRGVAMVFSAR